MFGGKRKKHEDQMKQEDRLPPGQSATLKFPVLHTGRVPKIDLETWELRLFGAVDEEVTLSWAEFTALPTTTLTTDIHCVTGWSKFGTTWEGVRFRDLLDVVELKEGVTTVMAHDVTGYTTNVPYQAMLGDDVLLAYKFDGEPLTPDHGFPVRTLVPELYFWKSCKWVGGLEFLTRERKGYWERAGYHNEGDPWKEQRYAGR